MTRTLKNKKIFIMILGCIISAVIGLGCWYILDEVVMYPHVYITIAIVNCIGYIGQGVTSHIIQKYIIKE